LRHRQALKSGSFHDKITVDVIEFAIYLITASYELLRVSCWLLPAIMTGPLWRETGGFIYLYWRHLTSLTYSNKEPIEYCGQFGTMTCTCRHLAADTATKLSVSAPCLGNSLPIEMKNTYWIMTFKRLLNTHLFRAVHAV